jgi:hypothetical protein
MLKTLLKISESVKCVKRRNPRWYHKHIITPTLISEKLAILDSEENGDILYTILRYGKAKWFKNKPKIRMAMLVNYKKAVS